MKKVCTSGAISIYRSNEPTRTYNSLSAVQKWRIQRDGSVEQRARWIILCHVINYAEDDELL